MNLGLYLNHGPVLADKCDIACSLQTKYCFSHILRVKNTKNLLLCLNADLNLKVKIGNPLIFFCSLNPNVLLDVSNCLTPWQVTVYVNRYDGR